MAYEQRRSVAARGAAVLAVLCGIFGLLAGVTGHVWKLGVAGWFTGGVLLTLLALFALVDGAVATQHQ